MERAAGFLVDLALKTNFDGLLTFNDLEKNKHKRPKIWNHASRPISIVADVFVIGIKVVFVFDCFEFVVASRRGCSSSLTSLREAVKTT